MGKIYGDRWETISDVGKGGQGEVFEARDRSAPPGTPTVALKRVRNPNRFPRFRNEVESIKQLNHPNIIKLIDHSALDVETESPKRQYLVTPLAHGGDLSKRVSMFTANLDGTLIVARQIALALKTAHAAGIVHRDVKPQNILFVTAETNDVWLTDFGICFVRGEERPTESDEVVGPWAFIAPELEYGGVLDVRPSADVYSLGKLIYYMISGGVVIPRERLSDAIYEGVFAPGGRYHLLNLLLRKMICEEQRRLASMDEVMADLERIADWDKQSALAPVAPQTLSKLEELQRAVVQSRETAAANLSNREAQKTTETSVLTHVNQWLHSELEKAAAVISNGGVLSASVRMVAQKDVGAPILNGFHAQSGAEMAIANVSIILDHQQALQILLCLPFKMNVEVTYGHQRRTELIKPAEDRELGILPVYVNRSPTSRAPATRSTPGYLFGETGDLVVLAQTGLQPSAPRLRPGNFPAQASSGKNVLFKKIRFSEWPSKEAELRSFVTICCDYFIGAVQRNKDVAFPR